MNDAGEGGEVSEAVHPEPPPPSEPPPPRPPPPPAAAVDSRIPVGGVALITFVLSMASYFTVSIAGAFINLSFSVLSAQLAMLGTAVVVLRLSRRSIPRFTGLVGSRPRAFLIGGAIGLGNALLFSGPLHALSKSLFPEWMVKMFDVSELIARMDFLPLEKFVFFAAVVVIAPIVEELLFRGVFFRSLAGWSPVWAAVLTAAVFSAFHLDPVGFLARFEIGLLLAWLFWKTRSLGACIGAHAANNLLAMAGAALVGKGAQDQTEPAKLTGWAFMMGLGALLMLPAVRALWRSEAADWAIPADDPEMPRRSFFAEVLPWVTAMIFAFTFLIRFDANGAQLTIIDLTTPVRAAKTPLEHHEREVMQRVRRAARDGTGSIRSYAQLRSDLQQREGR